MINLDYIGDSIRLGVALNWAPFYDWRKGNSSNYISDQSDNYAYDRISQDVASLEFRSPLFNVRENFGYEASSRKSGNSIVLGYPPSVADLPSKLNRLRAIGSVIRFLKGRPAIGEQSVSTEHSTAHFNLTGTVHEGAVCDSHPGGPFGDYFLIASVNPAVEGFALSGHGYSYGIPPLTYSTETYVDLMKARFYNVTDQYFHNFGTWQSGVKDLKFNFSDDGRLVSVTWTLVEVAGPADDGVTLWYATKETQIGIGVSWRVVDSTPTTSDFLYNRYRPYARKCVRLVRQYNRGYGETPSWIIGSKGPLNSDPDSWPSSKTYEVDFFPWSVSTTPMSGWSSYSGISGVNGYRKIDTGPTSYVSFRREVTKMSSDLLPLGFIAQGDAYDTSFITMKTNMVEFVSELADIASLVETPLELVFGKRGNPGDFTLKRILDLYTTTNLYYSFMLRPSYQLAKEMSEKSEKLLGIFDTFFGWQTINGKCIYEIGDEIPYLTGSTAVGRTKMRVRVPPDSLLGLMMPLEKMRLLPTLSNYWETVRGSFIVDWFFNVGSKLKVIDNTFRFMALDVGQCVNSVALHKEIVPINFTVDEGTAYKYYCRYVLDGPQVFTPTTLNILGGTGIPSYLTAGSLLYKKLS